MGKGNPLCLWKFILIYFVYFHNISSSSDVGGDAKKVVKLIDKIKFCDTVNVIGDSFYVNVCGAFNYPETLYADDPNIALCVLVFDTTSKICEYSSKLSLKNSAFTLLPSSVKELDAAIKKYEYFNNNTDICKNISSVFNTSSNSNIEGFKYLTPYIKYSQNNLLTNTECSRTCSESKSLKINHLCMYLLWVSDLFTSLKPINTDNNQESLPAEDSKLNVKASMPEKNHENDTKKPSQISAKSVEKDDKIPKTTSKIEKPQNKAIVLPTTNKKSDDIPKHQINAVDTSNNEPKIKPKGEKQLENENSHISAPPKEEEVSDIVESKKNEGSVDNLHQVEPDDVIQDNDSTSAEDHQNKKGIYEPGEGNDQENVDNDQKESNIQGAEMPLKIPEEDDKFDQKQKFLPQPDSKAEEESHFFTYFSIFSLLCIVLYFGYHNKQKIFAILLEGRRSRRGRGSRRRPSTASYRKLDCNLEEAVTSQCNSNVTHVIY